MAYDIEIDIFVVRNKEGKYFRAKGYGGYGQTWVDNIKSARLYSKIGAARAIVTFFASKYPSYGVPEILRLTVSGMAVVDDKDRVTKVLKAKRKAEEEQDLRNAEHALQQAQKRYADAKVELEQRTRLSDPKKFAIGG